MNIKKIVSVSLIAWLLPFFVYAQDDELSCSYTAQIDDCISANKNGSQRSIQDYSCPSSKDEQFIAYQVILDKEFQKVDEKVDLYLTNLEQDKSKFFGVDKKGNTIDAVNEIEGILWKNGDFYKQYMWLCGQNFSYKGDTILEQSVACLGKTTIWIGADYLFWATATCADLVEKKTQINTQVAYNILALNKAQVRKDEKKIHMQASRIKYNTLIDIMNINLGYMERIWMKLPSKIRNVL